MSIDREKVPVAVITAANDEKLVSRIRFQKTVYLLEQLGLGSGFGYAYHHYGPYSRDLDNAMEDAKAFDLIGEEYGRRASDGAPFSIFRPTENGKAAVDEKAYGSLGRERVKGLVDRFAKTNLTVLELAATAHWLYYTEGRADWKDEIKKRKGVKTEGGRLEKAIMLLEDLGLAPQQSAAA